MTDWKQSTCFAFLQSLHVAVISSMYYNVILRPKQVICLEKLFLGHDVVAVLPTGYGKSLIFYLLPLMLFAKENGITVDGIDITSSIFSSVVIIVTPINALMEDQIKRIKSWGFRASIFNVKEQLEEEETELSGDFLLCEKESLKDAKYNFVFAHPESFLSCKFGRDLLNSSSYQQNICAIVIDEAHCILEW